MPDKMITLFGNNEEKPKKPLDVNSCSFSALRSLTDEEVREAATRIIAAKPHIADLTDKEVQIVLQSLPLDENAEKQHKMQHQMGFGVDFLKMLQDREGTKSVMDFARVVNKTIDTEQDLHDYDFPQAAREALAATRKRYFLREFGPTMGTAWLALGVPTAILSGNKAIADGIDLTLNENSAPTSPADTDDKQDHSFLRSIRRRSRTMDRHNNLTQDLIELGIGAGLSIEGVQHYARKLDEQIDEISDAVSELSKRYPELIGPAPEVDSGGSSSQRPTRRGRRTNTTNGR